MATAQTGEWSDPNLNYSYFRQSWNTQGRKWMEEYGGLKWNEGSKKWVLDEAWTHAQTDVAQQAYTMELAAQVGVDSGAGCHDLSLLNELAEYFLAFSNRFTTLAALQQRATSMKANSALLKAQGAPSARTLTWVEQTPTGLRVRECTLCNAQAFHPIARLLRVIAALPASQRGAAITKFVEVYTPLLVHDHLLRLLYEADPNRAKELPKTLVDIWRVVPGTKTRPKRAWDYALQDTDLYLIATSAEMLGANAADPRLVPLSPDEKSKLRVAVQAGVKFLQSKRTLYKDTKDFKGRVVGSTSYFNGDFTGHPDMAYAGYDGKALPRPEDKHDNPNASWDISHAYRLPVFMRSMYDNRAATGTDFPMTEDVNLLVNQYVYRAFRGDFSQPQFNNFLDGSDGWYRVGYHGGQSGYAPAPDCDMHDASRLCLTPGNVMAWGELNLFSADLDKLELSIAQVAFSQDSKVQAFRERYYWYNSEHYVGVGAKGEPEYPLLMLFVLGENASRLKGCTDQH
jgi:hypothetical protein